MESIEYNGQTYYKSRTEAEIRIHVSGTGKELMTFKQNQIEEEVNKIIKWKQNGGYLGKLITHRHYSLNRLNRKTFTHELELECSEDDDSLKKEEWSNRVVKSVFGNRVVFENDKEKQLAGIDCYIDGKSCQIKYDHKMTDTGNIFIEIGTRPCELEKEIEYRNTRYSD